MINKRLYIPQFVKIKSVKDESVSVKSFSFEAKEDFKPGQFFQVSVLGIGEVPISVSSSPTEKGFIELTVRNIGKTTGAIHNLTKGDAVGLRGPYGSSFYPEDAEDKNLIFVAGGIGLAPLRSLIRYVLHNRKKYKHIYLLYGAKTQGELIFEDELKKWKGVKDFNVLLSIDKAEKGWRGGVGVVTTLFHKLRKSLKEHVAFVCGPPIMIKYTINKLLEFGVGPDNIFVTLERYMKCGVGKCGHCYLVNKYVCMDGPVFTYSQLKDIKAVEPLLV